MKLIEKKCPSCGADLEFDENAKSCKCSYCKKSFEIERDENDIEKINLVFDKVQSPAKVAFLIPFILAIVIFLIAFSTMFFRFNNRSKNNYNDNKVTDVDNVIEEKETIIKDANELTTENMDDLERHASSVLHQSVTGRHDSEYAFSTTGDPRLVSTYVAWKEEENRVILIYSVIYQNFFHQEQQYTVYIPSVIENVKTDTFLTTKAKNPSPEFYLNKEHSTYVYAYGSEEDAYNGVLKPLENDGYTVTKKQ